MPTLICTRKVRKRLSIAILAMITAIYGLALTGCTDRQPARVAWLSIEKPPIKVIYIDEQGNLDPVLTSKMFHIVGQTPYRNIKLNENTNVSVSAQSHQTDTESDTDSSSLTVQRGN
jgi:hypothetical protein